MLDQEERFTKNMEAKDDMYTTILNPAIVKDMISIIEGNN